MPEDIQDQDFNLLAYAQNYSQENELVRTVEVRPGATMDIQFIGRTAWRKLSKALRRVKGSEVARDAAAETRVRKLLAKAIKGWDGFSPEVVAELIPVKPEGLPHLLPCTDQNKEALLLHSLEFSNLVADEAENLAAFREDIKEVQEKN